MTLAERLIPAADLSGQISLAGKEASGTGNMKFTLNGALTVGTEDVANVEIRRLVGDEHFSLFGMSEPQVADLQAKGYVPGSLYESNRTLKRANDSLPAARSPKEAGAGQPCRRRPALQRPVHGARGLPVLPRRAQQRVDAHYADPDAWNHSAILNVAGRAFFSSDRSMRDYVNRIWGTR